MRGLFIRPLGACNIAPFEFKNDISIAAAAIMAGASLLGTAGSSIAQSNLNSDNRDFSREMTEKQNEFNAAESEKARLHQTELLNKEQQWNEYMYNNYQSPSALRRQYEEAGYNPYLVESSGSVGGNIPNGPSAPSSPQAQGVSPINPNTSALNFDAASRGISDAASMYFNSQLASANVANTSAKTLKDVAEAFNTLVESGMSEDDARRLTEPFLKGSNGLNADSNMFYQGMSLSNEAKKLQNDMNSLQLSIEQEFGRTERADKVMNMEQQFSVMAAEIGRLAVQNKLDESYIDRVASEISRNFAEAGLSSANADLIRNSMAFWVSSAQYEARSAWFDQANKERGYNLDTPTYNARMSELGQKMEVVDYYSGQVADKVGKLMKVNLGFSNGKYNSKTYFESQNKNWNVRSNFDYKHGITAP